MLVSKKFKYSLSYAMCRHVYVHECTFGKKHSIIGQVIVECSKELMMLCVYAVHVHIESSVCIYIASEVKVEVVSLYGIL